MFSSIFVSNSLDKLTAGTVVLNIFYSIFIMVAANIRGRPPDRSSVLLTVGFFFLIHGTGCYHIVHDWTNMNTSSCGQVSPRLLGKMCWDVFISSFCSLDPSRFLLISVTVACSCIDLWHVCFSFQPVPGWNTFLLQGTAYRSCMCVSVTVELLTVNTSDRWEGGVETWRGRDIRTAHLKLLSPLRRMSWHSSIPVHPVGHS